MKIDLKDKKTRTILIISLIIIIPILFNQMKTIIGGVYSAYVMTLPQKVMVAQPIEEEILPTFKTNGRIAADSTINVIARVSGWLQGKYFKEGDYVKQGQRLFFIEPQEYALTARNAGAAVRENLAVYKNAQINLNRARQLYKEDLVSKEYYDNALTDNNKNKAALEGASAQYSKARLELSYTNIKAPISGRIGKVNVFEGNFVGPESGPLAQIYRTNPIRVEFSMKSADFIKLKRYKMEHGNDKSTVSVLLELSDGSLYNLPGEICFANNKIDEGTGTVTMSALFKNPNEILVPGDYANVIIRFNTPAKVMLIPQSATKTDMGSGYYVWVVKDNKIVKRNIVVKENVDNYWIVEKGLDYNDVIVVDGIQNLYKSGQKISAKVKDIRKGFKGQKIRP